MSEDLLSIVVPVYNVEQYLDQSIQSILHQTYSNMEVILVNDGSTDNSGKICEKYAGSTPKVKLISQKNMGLAAAWKSGVRKASGTYIGFVDPDDYIDADLYQQMMDCREGFDTVIAQWFREDGDQTRRSYDTIRPGAYRTPEDMDFLIRHLINVSLPGGETAIAPGIAAYLWNKLFRTELMKEVFEELDFTLPFSNDRPFLYSFLLKCKSVLITEICGYHYRVRKGSLGRVADCQCDYIKTLCDFYNLMHSIFQNKPQYQTLLPQLQLKFSENLTHAPTKMGFGEEAQIQLKTPVFPFLNQLDGKRIVLYGAGKTGQSYRRQIQKWNVCQVELWVDDHGKEYSRLGLPVSAAETVPGRAYDCVVIAVSQKETADQIRMKCVSMGIEANRTFWRAPLHL